MNKNKELLNYSNKDKLTVQKSLPLTALYNSDLTLGEFKILDTYLSRINSYNPEKRNVVFEKGKLEELLGVKRIRTDELEKRLIHLMSNVVKIPDKDTDKGFTLITLFEKANAEKDDNGIWQVNLECTQNAMKYIFNINNLGYIKYKLHAITHIKSRYAYIMFIYLETNSFRKSWTIELDELKKILKCDKTETYKEFKFFNNKLLKAVQTEIHEKTKLRYEYEPIRSGKQVPDKITAIKFTIEETPDSCDMVLSEDDTYISDETINITNKELWEEALEKDGVCEFSKEQIEEIRQLLITVPDIILPMDPATNYNDIGIRRYHYIAQQYATLNRINSERKIKNRFLYFKKLIEKDAKTNYENIQNEENENDEIERAALRRTQREMQEMKEMDKE